MTAAEVPAEAVTAAAEAMEDAAMRLIGRDLGTLYRNDIAAAALAAALPLIEARIRADEREKCAAKIEVKAAEAMNRSLRNAYAYSAKRWRCDSVTLREAAALARGDSNG